MVACGFFFFYKKVTLNVVCGQAAFLEDLNFYKGYNLTGF